jgi:S-adenosylmethionine-dependent methyltransferase
MLILPTRSFEWLNLIGCEGIVAGHEEKINQISGPLWEQWVDLNYKLGQEPTLYGAADHLLYIGRKK